MGKQAITAAGLCFSLWAGPGLSQDAMAALDCDRGVQHLMAGLAAFDPTAQPEDLPRHHLDGDGWCVMAPHEDTSDFDIRWRAPNLGDHVGAATWPEVIEFELTRRSPLGGGAAPTLERASGTLLYTPGTKAVGFGLVAEFVGGNQIDLSLRFSGFDGSSASGMRLSVGSARVTEFAAWVTTTEQGGDLLWYRIFRDGGSETQIEPEFIDNIQGVMDELLRVLPESLVSAESQDDLAEFILVWPGAVGELHLALTSENGIGLYQLGSSLGRISGGAQSQFDIVSEPEDFVRSLLLPAMEILLHGAEVTIRWEPS